jgi:hypothetical protein
MFARPDTLVSAVFVNDTPIEPASVRFYLNNQLVNATAIRNGDRVTITHTPPRLLQGDWYYVYVEWNGGSTYWGFRVPPNRAPNGNIYEFVQGAYNWEDARSIAENRTMAGRKGHLATITSDEEFWFVDWIRWDLNWYAGIGEFWLGAYQAPDGAEPAGGWFWVNNEGPVGEVNDGPVFARWAWGQPDDWQQREDHMTWPTWGWWNDADGNGKQPGFLVEYEATALKIDIKPDDASNSFNLDTAGKTAVAILSTPAVNATKLQRDSIRFGPAETAPIKVEVVDVNKDKRPDLLCTFVTQDIGLNCWDKQARLSALDDKRFPAVGSDAVKILLCPVYQLTLNGLVDIAGVVDFTAGVTILTENCVPPTQIELLDLKSTDGLGTPRWSQVLKNIPLQPVDPSTSVAQFQASGVSPHAPVEARANLVSCRSGNILSVRAETVLQKAPDWAVESAAEGQVFLRGVPVNIAINFRELQGDLPAYGRAQLYEGDQLLSEVGFLYANPGEGVTAVFTTVFAETGTRHLRVVVEQLYSRDYDLSNNEKTFSIEVAPAVSYAGYYRGLETYESRYFVPGYIDSHYAYQRDYESLGNFMQISGLQFPIDSIECSVSVDGASVFSWGVQNITPDWQDSGFAGASFILGDGYSVHVFSPPDGWWESGYVHLYKYAYKDVYYSGEYKETWKENPTTLWEDGKLLHPQSAISPALSVTIQGETFSYAPILEPQKTSYSDGNSYNDPDTGAIWSWQYQVDYWWASSYKSLTPE